MPYNDNQSAKAMNSNMDKCTINQHENDIVDRKLKEL